MVPRSLPTFFSPDPTTRGPAGPRALEYPGRGVQTALSGSSGKREDRPGHPAFPRERTPCIALPSASCSSVLWSFFLSVPLSLSQPLRFACPLGFLWSCLSAGLPGSAPFPVSASIRASLRFLPHLCSSLPLILSPVCLAKLLLWGPHKLRVPLPWLPQKTSPVRSLSLCGQDGGPGTSCSPP